MAFQHSRRFLLTKQLIIVRLDSAFDFASLDHGQREAPNVSPQQTISWIDSLASLVAFPF